MSKVAKIKFQDYRQSITKALDAVDYKGVFDMTMTRMVKGGLLLVTADSANKPNVMTIGWGSIGSVWGKDVFIPIHRDW